MEMVREELGEDYPLRFVGLRASAAPARLSVETPSGLQTKCKCDSFLPRKRQFFWLVSSVQILINIEVDLVKLHVCRGGNEARG